MRNYNQNNCTACIRGQHTDKWGRTITIFGQHAHAWGIEIKGVGSYNIERFSNGTDARKRFNQLKRVR